MTKAYAVLQKKLKELEAELNVVLSLPGETPCHELLSEGMDRRLLFLRNLLLAEIESHPYKPQHLNHIDQRLVRLETIFHDWDTIKTTSSSPTSQIDNVSMCSCGKSYFDDDEFTGSSDMGGSHVDQDESEIISQGGEKVVDEQTVQPLPPLVFNQVEGKKKGEERKRVWISKSGGGCVITLVVIFALVVCLGGVVMAMFYDSYYYKEDRKGFPTPT